MAVLVHQEPRVADSAGNSIVAPDPEGLTGRHTSLVLDADGNPAVSYYEASTGDLRILRCGNPTCTGGNTIASPDTAGFTGLYTSITLDADDNPVVSYAYNENFFNRPRVLRCGNPTCTAGNTIAAPDEGAKVLYATSIALDAAGNPIVAYYDDEDDDLKVLHCGNPTCTAGNNVAVPDVLGFAGAYASLELDTNGNPVVSYNRNYDLALLRCGNPSCTANNVITTLDSPGLAGDHTSLELDPSGDPVISYYDTTNGNLKVLRCILNSCAIGNRITSPDTADDVGQYTSLELDASGNPVVSYYDATNGDLKILRCGDAYCASGNSIATADGPADVGQYSSLALDAAGNPVVGYHDVTNGRLNVLHCVDPACANVKPPPTATATPTPTRTPAPPLPPAVGGIAELPDVAQRPAETTAPPGRGAVLWASVSAAAAAAAAVAAGLGVAAWRGRGR